MYFPSKKDSLFRIIIIGSALISILPGLITLDWITLLILFPIGVVLLWLWFRTGYLIDGEQLKIKFGPFKKTISIHSIRKLTKTKSLLSSPALSMNRIEIMYNNYDIVYISPEYENEFIHFLQEVNPNMEIDDKLLEGKTVKSND